METKRQPWRSLSLIRRKERRKQSFWLSLASAPHGALALKSYNSSVDSSQYPNEHSFFGYSQDAGALESGIARVIDKLPTKIGCTLREVAKFFVEAISLGDSYESDDASDSYDDDDITMFDEELEPAFQGRSQTSQISLDHLMRYTCPTSHGSMLTTVHRDFVGVKAAGYNPGIIWTGSNNFILSVSLPVSDLFQHILPHALLAWDRHFLEPGSHLTLLISGFRDVYPVPQQDDMPAPNVRAPAFKFRVGFTQQYKPSKDNAIAAFREYIVHDTDKDGKDVTSDDTTDSDMMDPANDPDPGKQIPSCSS